MSEHGSTAAGMAVSVDMQRASSDQFPTKLDEYRELGNNIRHYSTLRHQQLTIFMALNGALMALLWGRPQPVRGFGAIAMNILGLLTALLFGIMQRRTYAYWNHFLNRAEELEMTLGFKQYSTRPTTLVFSARNAIMVIHISLVLLWITTLLLQVFDVSVFTS